MRLLLLLIFLSLPTFAQHSSQPDKESASDLRSGLIMFSIFDIEEETTYWLERTSSDDYFLRMKEDDKEKIQKLSSRDAKKLDMEFASKFLKAMYELPPSAEGCKASLKLNMKGEGQNICAKDDKKTQEFVPFAKALAKRF
jgi:hypothetical protein